MDEQYCVYILSSKIRGTLYIGVTSNLQKRIWEHKNKVSEGFSNKYNLTKLVHFEIFDSPEEAIRREKQLKRWNRSWKIELIEKENPGWLDLYYQL